MISIPALVPYLNRGQITNSSPTSSSPWTTLCRPHPYRPVQSRIFSQMFACRYRGLFKKDKLLLNLSDFSAASSIISTTQNIYSLELSGNVEIFWFVNFFLKVCGWFIFIQDEDASGGDQDQEERRWNKRTQQMLHGLQVCQNRVFITDFGRCSLQKTYICETFCRTYFKLLGQE